MAFKIKWITKWRLEKAWAGEVELLFLNESGIAEMEDG